MKFTLFVFAFLAIAQLSYGSSLPEVGQTDAKQNEISIDQITKFIEEQSKVLMDQVKSLATDDNLEKLQSVFREGVAKAKLELDNFTKKSEQT